MNVNQITNLYLTKSEFMPKTAHTSRVDTNVGNVLKNVFSNDREIVSPAFDPPEGLNYNMRMKMDGLDFLQKISPCSVTVAFFDPQYRGVLDKLDYGNEGVGRGRRRCALKQMTEKTIKHFIQHISACVIPSGHLFLWMDKFHLCAGFSSWLEGSQWDVVDMVTWCKGRIGMGYRTRRTSEHLIVLQKHPKRAKGVWKVHNIPDVWHEEIKRDKAHTHKKPVMLQGELIAAVSNPGDIVIDPAAGSFSVLDACINRGRNFLGCDLNG